MFLRNYWYVATWAKDLGRKPLARIMLNEPVVLFRKQDGTPVALEDRCIHRRLPLSMGRLIGDEIQCHYHGLVFDGTGTCVKIPGQERIPPSARVKSYPVVERNQCVFVWMGDADAPDTSRLPTHFSVLDNEGWTTSLVYRPVQCNFQLINDNLLDLSHLATVHASTVGTAHVADLADVEAERDGNHVKVSRWTMDAPAATTYQQFGNYDGNIDRWQISEFFPPSYFRINNGAASANTGARDGKGDKRWDFWVSHGITPETESSTHYFWALAHNTWTDNAGDIAEFHRQCHHVVGEDLAVFDAQQACIDLDPAAPTLNIRYDAGPMMARRIIDRLLSEEGGLRPDQPG